MLTKRIGAGRRVVGFTAGALFLVHEQPVAGFPDMTDLLPRVAADPYMCVVRGAVLPHVDRRCCRRLCDRTLHGDAVTFEPAARRWIALDIDGLDDPECFPADPETIRR